VSRLAAAAVLVLVTASPSAAQDLSLRPFVMLSQQQFAAKTTFEAVFDQRSQMLFGGGLSVTEGDHFYLDLTASRFEKTGERAFLSGGQAFRLGIPLTVTITPLEATAGYRFHAGRWLRPYVGGGVGLYRYKESSDFSVDDEDVDVQHAGGIVEGGVEVRLHRWIGVAADVHYTRVPGILGDGGISKDADEKDLGGVSARFKVIIGR
jgi:opacity protein-like surface antigen